MKLLLELTLSGSVLALLLLFLRYVALRRMPSTVYYYAWILVLLRFALPLPGLIPAFVGSAVQDTPVYSETYTRDHSELMPDPVIQNNLQAGIHSAPSEAQPSVHSEETAGIQEGAPLKRSALSIDWRSPSLWLSVWAAGSILSFGVTVAAYVRFTAHLRHELHKPDLFTRKLYASIPGRKPALFRSDAFRTSLMFGVFKPKIVLPERLNDEEHVLNILHHEIMHYRRRDTLYKWIAAAILSLHWFNPLSWFIRKELNRACELSCDEMLMRSMTREEKQSYGNTLLSMAASAMLPAGVVATTFSTDRRNLKERLEQIMHYKKNGARTAAAVLAIVLLAGCGMAAGPAAGQASNEPEQRDDRPVVRVSNVDELLEAIAPDTVIEIASGEYDLSTASNYGSDTHSAYYSWNGVWSEEGQTNAELVIGNVDGLTLRGEGLGKTVISAVPRYANVIKFIGCRNLTVSNLTAGHTEEPGQCAGGVLRLESCSDVSVNGCGLFGCGTIGVDAVKTFGLAITGCDIYQCSYDAVNLNSCQDVKVENCNIYQHGTREGTGAAIAMFSADYSEGIVISNNSIFENASQGLLRLSYTKNAAFISNEVHDNRFDGAVFMLSQYAPVVDGCSFENNGHIYQWVQSDGAYPSDITGKSLEAKDYETMKLREIDPAEAVKPAPATAAVEVRPGGSIEVDTVDEFLSAIGPDRTIILNGKMFDLSTAANYGSTGGEYYAWQSGYDGPQLVIRDADGLSIRASTKDPKATTIAAIPRYANVLSFQNCNDLQLTGFTAGHTTEPGLCAGGVLGFQNCSNIQLDSMRLYGCGILGIQAWNCATVSVLRSEIYECSQGAAQFYRTDGIAFENCSIHDVPSPALVFNECGDKVWNGEPLSGLSAEYDVDKSGNLTQAARGNMMPASVYQPGEESVMKIFFYENDLTGSGITTHLSQHDPVTLRAEASSGSGVFTWSVDREGIYELSPNEDGSECVLTQIGSWDQGPVTLTVERDGMQAVLNCYAMP